MRGTGAAGYVSSHTSLGPIPTSRELSLTGAVVPDIWRPPAKCRPQRITCGDGHGGPVHQICARRLMRTHHLSKNQPEREPPGPKTDWVMGMRLRANERTNLSG